MLPEELLPNISNLNLLDLKIVDNVLILTGCIGGQTSICPKCQRISSKRHSNNVRSLSDLPWAGLQAKLELKIRKFFCKENNCSQKIFTERVEGLIPFSRRTNRQRIQLHSIGLKIGGNGGSSLAQKLGIKVSSSTILRLLHTTEIPSFTTPKVLGVDDWAMRRGQVYGTVLVDLEKRKPIDLLPDREAETLENWLKCHPGVEIISRDRASAYSEGANKGAPDAIQIADRWHLLKNLTDALKRLMNKHNQASQSAAIEIAKKNQTEEMIIKEQEVQNKELSLSKPPSKYELIFNQVKILQQKNLSKNAISKQLGISTRTVDKYVQYDSFPKRAERSNQTSQVDPFGEYLSKRWKEHEHNVVQLWREIQEQGFKGDYMPVYRYTRKYFLKGMQKEPALKLKIYSANRLGFLLCRDPEKLKGKELEYLNYLFMHCPEAKQANELALRYRSIIVNQKADLLTTWLEDAVKSGTIVLKSFAQNLKQDFDAIYNACSSKWSNGQVEGQVNRIKNIKRQMYGRASFELLKKMVLADTG